MRVLITGATGMIGSRLADALMSRGDEVVGLSRDAEKAKQSKPEVTWHSWDATSEVAPAAALEGIDSVVNLIGEEINQRFTESAKERIRESRVTATKNLVEAIGLASTKPKALVSGSAVGIYGDRGDERLDEKAAVASDPDDFLARVCIDWEGAAREAEQHGVRVATLRTGLVMDPDGGLLGQLLLPFKLGAGGPLAGGKQWMPWIHRDDEVALLAWLARSDEASGVYNGAAPEPVRNSEWTKALAKAVHRPAFFPIPKLAVVALRGKEMADNATASLRAVPDKAVAEGFDFRHPDVHAAMKDLLD
ncbi:TIGR01777 family protein [Thermoleophilia bacterium SCSIO 60948]|nr:TIGR01777 family protein [Thermoleophilia bacterium SCSIO 60948]